MANHRHFSKKVYCANCGRRLLTMRIESWQEARAHKIDMTSVCDKPCEKSQQTLITSAEIYKNHEKPRERPAMTIGHFQEPSLNISTNML